MSKTTQPEKPVQQTHFSVTLTKPHTHDGVDYKAGAEIKVTAPERDFLLSVGVIKPNTAAPAAE